MEAVTVPLRVFSFWTDGTPISERRMSKLHEVKAHFATEGIEHIMVTPDNLKEWTAQQPLHSAYTHLSAVHRSDYLRCYFMHFHGGGYCDIKRPVGAWKPSFEVLQSDPSVYLVGYPEVGPGGVAPIVKDKSLSVFCPGAVALFADLARL